MKKLLIIIAFLLGGTIISPMPLKAMEDTPMCSIDDPCLYDGYAYTEGNSYKIRIIVKKNKQGYLVALIDGKIDKAYRCNSVPNSKQYCISYNGKKYYFEFT